LLKIARVFLATQATSVPEEKIFSQAGEFITKRKNMKN